MADPQATLPPAWRDIELGELADAEPRSLILDPSQLTVDAGAAGRALVYARAGESSAYDAIGFRTFAASPRVGPVPLQTSAWSAMQRALSEQRARDSVVDEVLHLQPQLRHRPLALPPDVERFRYAMGDSTIDLYCSRTDAAGRDVEERWTFSMTDPPAMLLQQGAEDRDELCVAAQRMSVVLEGTHWLPLPVLLAEGRFRRFQDVRDLLVRSTRPGAFYGFLSHRWLDPAHPDPEGRQARFAGWQLIAHLAEAVRVAQQRGLDRPRQYSTLLGRPIGPRGSDLAEALVVNVLRFVLDAETLAEAAAESRFLETALDNQGVTGASKDPDLQHLRKLLADCPVLSTLTQHIFVWYDYSCLPQPPREPQDVPLFAKGLEELVAAQILGRTVIMLDDADDYLSRAWCTLEALVADSVGGATDLIVGSARPTAVAGGVEQYFETLLQDRPHVVWRAILDTAVFGIQTPETCMARLGLDVTDARDLPFIYKRLSSLPPPTKTHIDDSEIVTGVFPLPAVEHSTLLVRARQPGRAVVSGAQTPQRTTLDWTAALSLVEAWKPPADSPAAAPAFAVMPAREHAEAPSCHVAIVAASEGEAIVLANWVRNHRGELETLVSVSIVSLSWVASDIAPIGHMVAGTLEPKAIATQAWAVVATRTRLLHCAVTGFITQSLRWAGVPHVTIALDEKQNNVEMPASGPPPDGVDVEDLVETFDLTERQLRTHVGGLFRWQLEGGLL